MCAYLLVRVALFKMPLDVIYLVDNRQLVLINLFKLNPIALEYEPESEDVGEMEETDTAFYTVYHAFATFYIYFLHPAQ